MTEYRGLLTKMEQESQADFDKTVLTLSGGALGLSFAFTKDVVGTENVIHTGFLLSAWIGWGLSSTAVLLSFFTSQLALRKAIRQLDDGKLEQTDKERMERPGGWYDWLTAKLNPAGLFLFLFGLAMMLVFLCFNVKDHMKEKSNTHAENAGLLVPLPSPAVKQTAASAKDSASNLQQAAPPPTPLTPASTEILSPSTSNQDSQ